MGWAVGVSGRARAEHQERPGPIFGVPDGAGSTFARCHTAELRLAVLPALR